MGSHSCDLRGFSPGATEERPVAETDAMPLRLLVVAEEPTRTELRRLLQPIADRWQVCYAASSEQAAAELQRSRFDVIASEASLVDGDGVALLRLVRATRPHMVRLLLSRSSADQALLRSIDAWHQYVPLPLSGQSLLPALARAQALSTLLASEVLRRAVGEMESLPAMDVSYRQLLDELRSPEPSVRRVGQIIGGDIALSARILQLVNSAFFGLPKRLSNPSEAVMLLGLETVKALALATNIFTYFDRTSARVLPLPAIRDHSTSVAALAKTVVRQEGLEKSTLDEAFISGLLHDIGKLVLAAQLPRDYARAMLLAGEERLELVEAERRIFGASHAEVGAYLLGLWGFPEAVLQGVAFHHSPSRSLTAEVGVLTAVHVANIVEHEAYPANRIAVPPHYDSDYLRQLNLEDRLLTWSSTSLKGTF